MGRENILKKKFKCSCTIVNCCNNQSGKQLAPSIKLRQDRPRRHVHQKSGPSRFSAGTQMPNSNRPEK